MAPHTEPASRLLLVEDDPISRGFFQIALESLPAQVECGDSVASALALAQSKRYDLALIDVNLPDGSGLELLGQLASVQPGLPALAHTAELSPSDREVLRAGGFLEVLTKPMSADRLQQAVRRGLTHGRVVSLQHSDSDRDWDESTALMALNGQQGHLVALRELFLAELPATRDAVDSALRVEDTQAVRGHLHRLQASCSFVGAARLAGAVRQLRGDPLSRVAQHQFHAAVAALLH